MNIFGTWEAWILYWVLVTYGHVIHYVKYKDQADGWKNFIIILSALLGVYFVDWFIGFVNE